MLIKMNNDTFKAVEMDLLSDDRCEKLISFLDEKKLEFPTLREIKRHFSEESLEDSFIDDLVGIDLIKRHHGKYQLGFPIVTGEQQQQTFEQVTHLLDSQIKEVRQLVNKLDISTFDFIYHLFLDEISNQIVLYEDTELAKRLLSYPTRITKVEGKRTTYVSLGTYVPYYSHNISDYFNYLTRNQSDLPEQFIQLRDRLGDINPEYFMNYCDRKLRRMEKGKLIPVNKPDLFLEALCDMEYCKISEEFYQFNIEKLEFSLISTWLNEIKEKLKCENKELSLFQSLSVLDWFLENNIIEKLQTHHGML